ncbi:uncharacterized protein LOC105831505 [Monomorium pharaonis]|uniref:uncharacterized protein LOC105831505 n=1 Tax=Monomorium pharaonis TaxID=307658 RepID=UPI00063F0C61|nr:uncharacterized protein LOC105831505 [Monomorium pharaonis]
MEGLCHIDIMNVAFIGMLFCAGINVEATGQDVITSTNPASGLDIETPKKFDMKADSKVCECINYDCGCCEHLTWDTVHMDGILCTNVSYLEYDYGISLTVTYNNLAIINETVSARNPPPICFGEDIVDAMDVEICLRIYDIHLPTKNDKLHMCFEILGKIMKLKITKIQLGCIQTELSKKIEYIDNLFHKKTKQDMSPNVIMV